MSAESNNPVVLFGGYSEAGKTTYLIPILKELGFTVLSSSILLHEFTDNIVKKVLGVKIYDSYDRELEIKGSVTSLRKQQTGVHICNSYESIDSSCGTIETMPTYIEKLSYCIPKIKTRDLCIKIAEDCLVPVFSRSVFVHTITDRIVKNPGNQIAVELFNAEEYNLLEPKISQSLSDRQVRCFNLRRSSEKPEADARDLIPSGLDIWNNGSHKDLKEKVLNFLS